MGTITVTGRTTLPGTGNLTNNVSIATTDAKYIDLNVNNNTAAASVAVTPGTDPEPLGSFPASSLTSTTQNFVLTYRNNGPQQTSAAVVTVAIPSGFAINSLPAGCVDTGTTGVVNGISGEIVRCTSGAVSSGGTQAFTIPLTTPATAASGNFGIAVETSGSPAALPGGEQDYNLSNNNKLVPYSVVIPSADLGLTKSKSSGPIAAGANITNSITVTNHSLATATYSAAGGATPLRVMDTLSTNEEYVSADAAWTCVDNPPSGGSHVVVCQLTGASTLASGASVTLTLTTRVLAAIATPTALSNTACTGATALTIWG